MTHQNGKGYEIEFFAIDGSTRVLKPFCQPGKIMCQDKAGDTIENIAA